MVFATASPFAVVVVGLPAAGFSYAFFHVVAAMYVDRLAPPHLRASAQGIITFVSLGLGTLAGNWLAAWVVGRHTLGASVDWRAVWLVPSIAATVIAVAFVALFRGADRPHRVSAAAAT